MAPKIDGAGRKVDLKPRGDQTYEKVDGGADAAIECDGTVYIEEKVDGFSKLSIKAKAVSIGEKIDGNCEVKLVATGGDIVIGSAKEGKIDGPSMVKLHTDTGNIEIRGKVDGLVDLVLQAPNGHITIHGKIDGKAKIKWKGKSFTPKDKTDGRAEVIEMEGNIRKTVDDYF
ncbi:hypothetical protein DFJ74DRAFT_678110 [Hyaloraphidium curvatum]|nr:hypothetical protein DFJ74DRAFT_678110 [Hyaloraphidium curvatum]